MRNERFISETEIFKDYGHNNVNFKGNTSVILLLGPGQSPTRGGGVCIEIKYFFPAILKS